jgi:Flp pilus assembly protein TadB
MSDDLTSHPAVRPPALPRSVRRGPPITVKCECGERRELRYGERWRCEGCGRAYDTNRIPVQEYASLRRDRVRDRMLPSIVFAAVAVVAAVLVVIGRPLAVIVVLPLTGFVWSSFVRPARRRRQYQAIADRPRWQIRAE